MRLDLRVLAAFLLLLVGVAWSLGPANVVQKAAGAVLLASTAWFVAQRVPPAWVRGPEGFALAAALLLLMGFYAIGSLVLVPAVLVVVGRSWRSGQRSVLESARRRGK